MAQLNKQNIVIPQRFYTEIPTGDPMDQSCCEYAQSYANQHKDVKPGQLLGACASCMDKVFCEIKKGDQMPEQYTTIDTGNKQEFKTGMQRNISTGKTRYDLVYMPMLRRWAELLTRGAEIYGERNWEKAATEEEFNRFKESAWRHFMQYMGGETDEDHAAAIIFNISGMEHVKSKLAEKEDAR